MSSDQITDQHTGNSPAGSPDNQSPTAAGEAAEHSAGGVYSSKGKEFDRDTRYIPTRIVANPREGADEVAVEAGRYRLIAARACPWANRTLIVRRLLGLEDALSIGLPGPTHDADSWTFDLDPGEKDPVLGIHKLKEAFEKRQPGYPRGITVPAIVDTSTGAVVTNDFDQITRDFSGEWTQFHREGAPDLFPAEAREEMEQVMRRIYTEVNNGVYRCGFAGSQEHYDAAYERLWVAMDWLEGRLSARRFLMGDTLTEADVRLFTTLVRFDPVYHNHFRCNRNTLREMPHLWGYARDLFQTPGFGDTVDFVQIKQHYYLVHTDLNPSGIIPDGPDLSSWLSEHRRDELSDANPFGRGTAPGPVRPGEEVAPGHGAV